MRDIGDRISIDPFCVFEGIEHFIRTGERLTVFFDELTQLYQVATVELNQTARVTLNGTV